MASATKLRRHASLKAFFALVVVLSLPFWALGALEGHLPGVFPSDLPVSAMMAVCPAMAAVLLVGRGPAGAIRSFLAEALPPRRHAWRYLSLLPLMPVVVGVSALSSIHALRPVASRPAGMATLVAAFVLAAVTEELGWSAYAMPRLSQRLAPELAALVLGIFWAAWHAVPFVEGHHAAQWILGQCAFTVIFRLLISTLSQTGRRYDVTSAVVLHASYNIAWAMLALHSYSPWKAAACAAAALGGVLILRTTVSARQTPGRCDRAFDGGDR